MALAIDGSTPAVATQATSTVATVTTASFTPPAGSTLLVLYSANTVDPTSPATPTITDSLGAHLTYTLSDFSARADTPAADGQAAIWTAPIASSAAMTITVTNQAPSGSRHAALAVIVLTGARTTPVGAHGKSGSISTASIAQAYTAQATSGWGFIAVCDWSAKGAMLAGTGCTLIGSANLGTPDISYGFVRRTSADDSNGVGNTLNVTLGGAATSVRWAYAEIVPAASTAAMLPTPPARRRPVPPKPSRTRSSTPVRAQVNPPFPFAQVKQPRRLRGLLPRRGHPVAVVPAQVIVAPPLFVPAAARPRLKPALPRRHTGAQAPIDQPAAPQPRRTTAKAAPTRRRRAPAVPPEQPTVWQALRARLKFPKPARGHTVQPTPAQAAVPAPTYPPQGLRARTRFLRQARGQAVAPVPAQIVVTPPAYVPQGLRARIRSFRLPRGRAAAPVPTQIVLAPPGYVPQGLRARIRSLKLPRSRTAAPVPGQVILTAPTYPPQTGRPHPRLIRHFRGRTAAPPQTTAPPPAAARARQAIRPVRRGRPAPVPPGQEPAPLFTRIKLRALRLFRGKPRPVVPAQIILVPPAYPQQSVRGKKRLWSLRRRRAGMEGWLVGASANPCVTPRPSTGTTARPGAGTTTYPLGSTGRPATGITVRPDTGTTDDPC